MDTLRAALNCSESSGGGQVGADWVGRVSVDGPVVVAEGTFLSVTGEDDATEVHGGSGNFSQTNRTNRRLFEVSQGGGLTLTRLKLSGGSAEGGGAIYSRSATVKLDSCVFEGNVATAGNGGAVWADGGSITMVAGEFLANNAIRYGGAVHAVNSVLVV